MNSKDLFKIKDFSLHFLQLILLNLNLQEKELFKKIRNMSSSTIKTIQTIQKSIHSVSLGLLQIDTTIKEK
jgi:hypothetical protein